MWEKRRETWGEWWERGYETVVIYPLWVVAVAAGLSWDWVRSKVTGQPRRW